MDDLQKRLSDLLQATSKKGVKLFVTSCILHELQGLGDEFTGMKKRKDSARLRIQSHCSIAIRTLVRIQKLFSLRDVSAFS